MPWPLKPPPQGGELLDRPRPQGIHRGDPQRTEATHAGGGTLGRGAGGQVLRWEDEVKKLSNIWGFNSLYSQFHLPICNSYLPRLVIQQFCWELVVWCFFVVHLCFWESIETMAAGLFFLMGKAVRKMTLSDPWMEGDDFQPGSQLNSFVSFGLVVIPISALLRSWADTFLVSRISTEMWGPQKSHVFTSMLCQTTWP